MGKTLFNLKSFCMVVLLALIQWTACGSLYAQSSGDSWKNEKITVRVSNQSLGHVLEMVAKKAKATLVFQGVSIIGINDATTLNVKDTPVDKVVGSLLKGQGVKVRFESGRQIVIEPAAGNTESDTAESFVIAGVVMSDDTKECLIGATIQVVDSDPNAKTAGCITDIDGKFSLRVNKKSSIRVSYIGYETISQQILRANRDMKIVLKPGGVNVDEVVVTGISKRSKTSFTGNYVTVKGDQLRKLNPNNILKSLQFFDPSFKIVENNRAGSDPNAQPEFQMRGDQSLGAIQKTPNSMDLMLDNVSSRPNTPLFVLDGFIVPISRVLNLDPERVESITVLKDAAATSIYGSRASNGVVVVETKVAPDGALNVSYSGNFVVQAPDLTDYNMMDAREKLQTEWMAGAYNPENATHMNEYNRYKRYVLGGVNTYWLSQPLQTAFQHRHSLNAAGGTDLFRYTLNLNAGFTPGVMKGSENNNKSVNFTMTYRKEDITVGASINLTETDQSNSPYGSFSQYTSLNPYYSPTDANGKHLQILDNHKASGSARLITNPLYNANVGIKDEARNLNIASTLNIEYMLMKNLRISEQLSYTRGMARTEKFKPADHTDFAEESDITRKGSYRKDTGEMTSWSSNFGINWNMPWKKHLFSVFGNWTISEDKSDYVNLNATGYPDVHMNDFIFGNKMDQNPTGSETISRQMGLIGTFSYSYDNRYSFDFNMSGEISSRYVDHSLTPFWSTGVRWNAHNEKWLQGRISNLVLRATYGVTGEQSFSPADAVEYYSFTGTMRPYTSFPMVGALLAGLNNPTLKWAKTDNLSIGLDFGFWKNRVNATFNYYNNITRQMLTDYDLAPSTGFDSQVINSGELQNQGFDASLNVIALQNFEKQINWTIGVNANHNKNKIRKISAFLKKMNEKALSRADAPIPVYQEGHSTTTYYAVRSLGVDPVTGKEVFLKRDGTKTFNWDANDKVPVGDTNPKVSGTVTSSFNWKDLSVGLGFSYRYGGITYNQTLVDKIENANISKNLDRRAAQGRWQKPGDVVRYKKIALGGMQTPSSTRFIMDDNEFKLSSLNVGYRFNNDTYKFLKNLSIDVLSVNFTTNDLFRLSTIKMERGLDYPFARTYTLSVSVLFK